MAGTRLWWAAAGSLGLSTPAVLGAGGLFGERVELTVAADNLQALQVLDVDDDEDLDIAFSTWEHIYWMENQGGGTFGPARQLVPVAALLDLLPADINGDQVVDLLTVILMFVEQDATCISFIIWHQNLGDRTFLQGPKLAAWDFGCAFELAAADVDRDGDLDVLSASDEGTISCYLNDGVGNLAHPEIIDLGPDQTLAIEVLDINGDLYPDIVYASELNGELAWYPNLGTAGPDIFGPPVIIEAASSRKAHDLVMADLNGDETPDVLVVLRDPGIGSQIFWQANLGAGTFGPLLPVSGPTDVDFSQDGVLAAADLDDDGDLDVLSASQADGKIAYYLNNGAGAFSRQRIINAAGEPFAIQVADLNGDGLPEVADARLGDHSVGLYDNLGVQCPDLDRDGHIGPADLALLLGAWGANPVHPANLNHDDQVNAADLALLLGSWGPCR